MNSLERS